MDKQQGPTYSTGNYIQSPGINHNGKEYSKKKDTHTHTHTHTHTYIKLSHFAVIQQRLTQHCKPTTLQ